MFHHCHVEMQPNCTIHKRLNNLSFVTTQYKINDVCTIDTNIVPRTQHRLQNNVIYMHDYHSLDYMSVCQYVQDVEVTWVNAVYTNAQTNITSQTPVARLTKNRSNLSIS